MIEACISVGMPANKIQKFLQSQGLGVRRKKLLAEIRAIKTKGVYQRGETRKERIKYIPKKYRKKYEKEQLRKEQKARVKWEKKIGKIRQIYRGSLIISSVPLHSIPFNRHYLGFRLNIFSYDKNEVYSAMRSMKKQFLKMVGNKLKSFQYASDQILGTENPKKINVTNPDNLNNRWFFAVEEKGSDIDSESGRI